MFRIVAHGLTQTRACAPAIDKDTKCCVGDRGRGSSRASHQVSAEQHEVLRPYVARHVTDRLRGADVFGDRLHLSCAAGLRLSQGSASPQESNTWLPGLELFSAWTQACALYSR